jgi:hypothetical protein
MSDEIKLDGFRSEAVKIKRLRGTSRVAVKAPLHAARVRERSDPEGSSVSASMVPLLFL